ncbi:MAG: hypothetical protein IKT08_05765 [Bacteroidales bacterium]|nr:hypothetical protein [Bacteroidales bacterium]
METTINNPLVIRCEYCGGDQYYDISKQKYCCSHCGAEASNADKKAEYRRWKRMRQEVVLQDFAKVKNFSCPSCGAQTMATGDDVSAQCPFCQNTMIDAAFSDDNLPEVILPFKITQEEAKNQLKGWIAKNRNNAAAKLIEKNLHRFTGCYLPYHLVRGGYNGSMAISLQDGSAAHYPFRAYLNHTAVNASKDWNNLFLDGIEPFDFSDAREFDFGFLNHQKAKVQNVVNEALNARVEEETRAELYNSLSKKVRTKEMTVFLDDDDNESIPALMPVYLVKCKDGVAAAVNGQTGKISIATGKKKNLTRLWWIWPVIATIVVGVAGTLWAGIELGLSLGLVFGLIFFAVAHNRHHAEIIDEVITVPKESKGHNDTRTEFYADFGQGPVPTELKFFTFWRITKLVVGMIILTFLPLLIAIPIQVLRGQPVSAIHIGYGAAWYIIPVFMAIVLAGGAAKAMMYGEPLYYEKRPNGKLVRRRLPSQKKFSLKQLLPGLKKTGGTKDKAGLPWGWAIAIVLFLLIGSVGAMLS